MAEQMRALVYRRAFEELGRMWVNPVTIYCCLPLVQFAWGRFLYSLLKRVWGNHCQTWDYTMRILTSQQCVICCLFVSFFPNYILKYKLVIAYRVQNWQVPHHPSFHTNTSKLFLGKEQPHSKKEPVQQKPCPNCSSPLKNCQCALLVPPKGGEEAVRTGGEFCNCGHIHEAQLNFCEIHSCRSVKTCTVWMKSRSF